MKRTFRNDMPQAQKEKIAFAMTGRHHSDETKEKISKSMQEYWGQLPYKPVTNSGTTNTDTGQTTPTTDFYY